jgi:Zn-dependent protease
MRDPFSWSFPIGRLFGVTIKIHILFPVVALGIILRAGMQKDVVPGSWIDVSMVMGLLFVSVMLHEFGHCFGARLMEGDANEILIWPLGGLAYATVPHTPRANFVMVACGPLTNLLLCVISAGLLAVAVEPALQPVWDPFAIICRQHANGGMYLQGWDGREHFVTNLGALVLTRFFWVNWVLLLLNVLVLGYPLDGGRMLQCVLWPRLGYEQATRWAVFIGFFFVFVMIIASLAMNEVLPLCLAVLIFASCRQQLIILETGGEESVFGYDFSQGYTSLERDQPPPPRKRRLNFWQRWLQRRAARKLQRELETREAEERRMDELLDKIQREGKQSLTDEEHRFLKRVADKYRNRQ